MSWLAYGILGVLCYGVWVLIGKLALRHLDWAQTSLFYGVAISLVVSLPAIAVLRPGWSTRGILLGTASGLVGAVGLAFFYLALERGKASIVGPLSGVYPVVTVILSRLVLGEQLSVVQGLGIACATLGVVLMSAGR